MAKATRTHTTTRRAFLAAAPAVAVVAAPAFAKPQRTRQERTTAAARELIDIFATCGFSARSYTIVVEPLTGLVRLDAPYGFEPYARGD